VSCWPGHRVPPGRRTRPRWRLPARAAGEGRHIGSRPGRSCTGFSPCAAPAAAYLLDDASLIILPATREFSADRELINGIGVAPDYYLPLTAQDLSTGHDPDIAKALTLLDG
jgi:hypothetical protein